MGGWWRWALVSPEGGAPSRMVDVSASVNLPLHRKVQKFSSDISSPGWSRKRAVKLACVCMCDAALARCGLLLWTEWCGLSVFRLVGLSVTVVSPAKTAEPIEIPSGMDWGGPKEACVTWESRSPHVKEQFSGRKEAGPGHVWRSVFSK